MRSDFDWDSVVIVDMKNVYYIPIDWGVCKKLALTGKESWDLPHIHKFLNQGGNISVQNRSMRSNHQASVQRLEKYYERLCGNAG